MQQTTIALVVTSVGITGTLAGVVMGHLLTRSWQQEQWLRDKRWQEYRELISAVTSSYIALIRLDAVRGTPASTRELSEEVNAIKHEAFRVIRDRLIIAKEIESGLVLDRWDEAVSNYDRDGNVRRLAERFTGLNSLVIHLALHPPVKASRWWQRRSKPPLT